MPDIELRFQRDMLVLSAPVGAALARQGIDATRDLQYLNLMEPDVVCDTLKLELAAGAHCLVATTEDITRARLAHVRMDGDGSRLAAAALDIANGLKPQHVLVEIGPCGLPLDASSKASLNENRAQYADAARLFGDAQFDAFLLTGFSDIADLKCALMGLAQASAKPVIASVTLGQMPGIPPLPTRGLAASDGDAVLESIASSTPFDGYSVLEEAGSPPLPGARRKSMDPELWPDALDTMVDLGASVVGFETADSIEKAVSFARTAVERTDLPVLAQLCAVPGEDRGRTLRGLAPVEDIEGYTADNMEFAAIKLYAAGVQFLRATGAATAAFTGALAATVQGLDVRRS